MSNDRVITLRLRGSFEEQRTGVWRQGARALLAQAVEAEVAGCRARHADLKTGDGNHRVVHHGHLLEREGHAPSPRQGREKGM